MKIHSAQVIGRREEFGIHWLVARSGDRTFDIRINSLDLVSPQPVSGDAVCFHRIGAVSYWIPQSEMSQRLADARGIK